MFKNKLLKALLAPFFMWVGEEGGGGSAVDASPEPTMDMDAASNDISDALFGAAEPEEKVTEDAADPEPETPPAKSDPAAPAQDDATTPPAPKLEAPNTWRAEAKADWDKLTPTAQAEIIKREADIFTGLEALKPNAALGKTFAQIIAPYQQLMTQSNTDPAVLTQNLMAAHANLSIGTPQTKLETIQRIANLYGVDLGQLAPAAGANDEPAYVDPQVKALQQQLAVLQSQLSGTATKQAEIDKREEQRVRASLSAEIDTFAADPANTYFNDVADDIARLLGSGEAKDLKEAYDKAVWLNPVTRAKEVARTTAEAQAKAKEEALEKAKKARAAAAANVRTTPKQASGTTLLGSIDDTLKAEYAKLTAKT